jgi:hypothetical protein
LEGRGRRYFLPPAQPGKPVPQQATGPDEGWDAPIPRTLEGRRILLGPQPDEPPQGALVRANATAPGTAPATLQRCRQLLLVVLDFLPDPPAFPTLHEWHHVLPPWFLHACGPERSHAEEQAWLQRWRAAPPLQQRQLEQQRPWTVADWLYWFDPASDAERSWRWWDIGVVDHDHFWIDVDVLEDPAALGTLQWLLRAAGATKINLAY